MDKSFSLDKMTNSLEINGDIQLYSKEGRIYIHSIDDKEGYSYITPSGMEFDTSRGAVEWGIRELKGINNITWWN
jgi:hypothetical protein